MINLSNLFKAEGSNLEVQLKKVIRTIGVKVTGQRMTILKYLINGDKHITAQELFENIKPQHPEIGFATVYRFLRTLTDHKVLSEVRVQGLPARYELANREHHEHISCTTCGKITEFENEQLEKMKAEIALSLGYIMTDHILELYGICNDCQKKTGQLPRALKN